MIGFLPERVYRIVKNDPEFKEWEIKLNEAIRSDDMVERIIKEETVGLNSDMQLLAKRDAVFKRLLSPDLERNVKIMETNDETTLLEMLQTETDLENKLFIYQNLIGIVYYLSTNPKVLAYIREFVKLVEESKQTFSEKIHEEYFTYKCFLIKSELFDSPRTRLNIGMFQEYCNQMDVMINEICTRFDGTNYIINLMHHCKVFQMFDFFATMLDYFGPRRELVTIIEKEVLPNLKANEFKYAEFNYYKIQQLDAIAKFFFDLRSDRFFVFLGQIIDTINSSFEPENRLNTNKALNYYNDSLTIYYLNLVTKYRHVVEVELPEYPKKINLEKMTKKELDITSSFLSSTDILHSFHNVKPYMSADKICNLCSAHMKSIEEYINFNKEHFGYFRNIIKKH